MQIVARTNPWRITVRYGKLAPPDETEADNPGEEPIAPTGTFRSAERRAKGYPGQACPPVEGLSVNSGDTILNSGATVSRRNRIPAFFDAGIKYGAPRIPSLLSECHRRAKANSMLLLMIFGRASVPASRGDACPPEDITCGWLECHLTLIGSNSS